MEERRLILAIALSLLVLTGYQLLFAPRPAARPPASPGARASAEPAGTAAPEAAPPASPSPLASPAPAGPSVADTRERRVEVTGQDVTAAFTNRGARLLSWRLHHYTDAAGRPEDMVETQRGPLRPLDLETGDAAVDKRLKEALFRPSAESLTLSDARGEELRFEYADADLAAEKTIRFQARGYLVSVSAAVRQGGRELKVRVAWGPGIGNPTAAEKDVSGYQHPSAVALLPTGVRRMPLDVLQTPVQLSELRWVGVESRYFAAVLVPRGRGSAEVRSVALPQPEGAAAQNAAVAALAVEAGSPALLYVGPKDYHILSGVGHELAQVVPVGDWIGPLVVPLLSLLRFVHRYVGNYGWSIVALTVVINVALGPLRHYSIANGLKMAKLAPEMRVIQERYRKVPALDPRRQEMQKEIQALYERHGMSMGTQMAVGCLPLLLTMPFLFAFYRVLDVSIDLRGADFLWISDLSQKDPLFVTPLLMGVSMFVMQKMTPTTMDPAQQRIMMLMPLMLVGMFFWAPAGLNLYWFVSNLCSIVQQGITYRLLRDDVKATAKEKKRR